MWTIKGKNRNKHIDIENEPMAAKGEEDGEMGIKKMVEGPKNKKYSTEKNKTGKFKVFKKITEVHKTRRNQVSV